MGDYSGYARSLSITITKRSDGIIDEGYPKTYPTTADTANGYFVYNGTHYNIPDSDELSYMSDVDYIDLVGVFILYVNDAENISITNTQINDNIKYDPIECSGDVPTTTTIEPTTTTIEPTIDFIVDTVCTISGTTISLSDYYGGSGAYEVGVNLYTSEAEALSATTFTSALNPYEFIAVADGTYWVVVRDTNNPTTKKAKMVVALCLSTTTLEPTTTVEPTTLEPTTTVEPTTTEPPVYELDCYNLHIPTSSLSSGGEELYVLYRDFSGNYITQAVNSLEDFGGYVDGVEILICSSQQPLYKYGLSGSIFNFVYWIYNHCVECCNENIDCEYNKPPVALNQNIWINRPTNFCLQLNAPYPDLNWFRYNDFDGDTIREIRILTLPQYGTLKTYDIYGVFSNVTVGQIIPYPFTTEVNMIWYFTSTVNLGDYVDNFIFQVRTWNNDTWSNTGKTSFIVSTCLALPTTTAEPQSCEIFVPEAFSPSIPDGVHDYFEVYGLWCYPNHRMSIFKRSGELVYRRTNDYVENPWDGRVGGVIIQTTYNWVLEINGSVHSTGSVYVY